MFVQLTAAGKALLDASTGPVKIAQFKVGDAYGYVPEASDTNIHGQTLTTGVPTDGLPVTATVYRYGVLLDSTVGPFAWGEVGLFTEDGTLFALGASMTQIQKAAGDTQRADIFVSVVGANYDMWLDLAESNNPFRIAEFGSVDQLPASENAVPNCYIIDGYQDDQQAFMAYTNRSGWWNFDAYDFQSASGTETKIVAVGAHSLDIANTDFKDFMNPAVPGDVITEVISGPAYSYARYVITTVTNPSTTTLNFETPWAVPPNVGDTIIFFVRKTAASDITIPPASTTNPGLVIVGDGLNVNNQGVVSVDYDKIPYPVTSFNGQTGAVTYEIKDQNLASGTTLITDSGLTDGTGQLRTLVAGNDISITLDQYNNLVISATGTFATGPGLTFVNGVLEIDTTTLPATTSFNGQTGAATFQVTDYDSNVVDGSSLVMDTGSVSNVAKLSRLVAGTGISIVRDGHGNLIITDTNAAYSLPIATATSLGGIRVGTGLVIDPATGILSTSGSQTTVNGMSGAVQIFAENAPGATGQSLIEDSGLSDGIIKLYALKAGAGVSITLSGGDLVIASSYTLPTAGTTSAGTLGGVRVDGTSITIDSNGVISAHVDTSSIPFATHTTSGVVIVGNTLSVTSGVIDYNLPIAGVGSGGTLGGVRVDGTSITINATTGVVSATGSVSSVNTLTGAVTIDAVDTSTASGTTLITDSGATTGVIKIRRIVGGQSVQVTTDGNNNLVVGLSTFGYLPGATSPNLMWNENGELGTANAAWLWTDSSARAITVQTTTSDGYFWRVAANATPASGTIKSPMYVGGSETAHVSAMQLRTNSAASGVFNYQVIYYNSSGTVVTTGALSSALTMDGNWHRIQTASDSAAATFTQFQVVINYSNATWTTFDWARGKVEANTSPTLYTQEGTIDKIAATANAALAGTTYVLPAATTTTLGGVKVGSGISVAADGTISLTNVVTSVNGLNGAVTVQTIDSNTASGVSLIADSGSTTGTAKLHRLVAGTNMTIVADSNGNLTLNAPAATTNYDVPFGTPVQVVANQLLGAHTLVRTLTIPAGFTGSAGYCSVAAASTPTTFTISTVNPDSSTTSVGTVTFAVGSKTPTWSMTGSSNIVLIPGTFIQIMSGASVDGTLAGIACTMLGTAV